MKTILGLIALGAVSCGGIDSGINDSDAAPRNAPMQRTICVTSYVDSIEGATSTEECHDEDMPPVEKSAPGVMTPERSPLAWFQRNPNSWNLEMAQQFLGALTSDLRTQIMIPLGFPLVQQTAVTGTTLADIGYQDIPGTLSSPLGLTRKVSQQIGGGPPEIIYALGSFYESAIQRICAQQTVNARIQMRRHIALHELGHSVGLPDRGGPGEPADRCAGDVMHFTTNCPFAGATVFCPGDVTDLQANILTVNVGDLGFWSAPNGPGICSAPNGAGSCITYPP